MNITARVSGIEYAPSLCRNLPIYPIYELEKAISNESSFLLETESQTKFAISHWISPKRTRSYPYARVYDTLGYQGRRVTIIPVMKDEGKDGDRDYLQYDTLGFQGRRGTIIPVMKDEGKDGDRDYLQYDTLALMGLFGVYVIISYYVDPQKSQRYPNKVTAQSLDYHHILTELERLKKYQSDALHWNRQLLEKRFYVTS